MKVSKSPLLSSSPGAPLIEGEARVSNGEGTLAGSLYNLVNTILGAGTLTIPYAFYQAGWLVGLIILVSVAIISWYSYILLVKCSVLTGSFSYKGLAICAYGRRTAVMSQIFVILCLFAVMTAYCVLLGDFCKPVFEEIAGEHSILTNKTFLVIVLTTCVLLPLSLLPDLHALRHTSLVAIIAVIFTMFSIMGQLISDGPNENENNEPTAQATVREARLFIAVPLMTTAFLAQQNILIVYRELPNRKRPQINTVIHLAILICLIIYFVVGMCGAYAFKAPEPDILDNYPSDNVLIDIARMGYLCTILFSFPILHVSCRENVISLFFPERAQMLSTSPTRTHYSDDVAFDELPDRSSLSDTKSGNSSVSEPIGSSDKDLTNGLSGHRRLQIYVTFVLVLSAMTLALVVPDIGVVFGFSGAINGTMVAYVLPGLFYFRLGPESTGSPEKLKAVGLVVVGTVLGILGLVTTALQQAGLINDKGSEDAV